MRFRYDAERPGCDFTALSKSEFALKTQIKQIALKGGRHGKVYIMTPRFVNKIEAIFLQKFHSGFVEDFFEKMQKKFLTEEGKQ